MSKLSLFTFIVCIYHTYNEICIMHRKILCQLSYYTPDLISTIFLFADENKTKLVSALVIGPIHFCWNITDGHATFTFSQS